MVAKRKGWAQLSSAYRSRLGKAGISERSYNQGVSLAGARGHASTPERPSQATKNPDKYPKYLEKHPERRPKRIIDRENTVSRLATRIRLASPEEAAGIVRRDISRLTPAQRIELARRLRIELSFPLWERFGYEAKLKVAEGWLLAFMTHAGPTVSDEPWLRYVRESPPGGPRDWVARYWQGPGVINIAAAEYRRLGEQGHLTQHDIYVNFKASYNQFFGVQVGQRRAHA